MADDYCADEGATIASRERLALALYVAGRRQDADNYAAASPADPQARLDLRTLARVAGTRRTS